MLCPKCGKLNWNGTPFCEFCGHMLRSLSRDVRHITLSYGAIPAVNQHAGEQIAIAQSGKEQSAPIRPATMQILDYPEPRRNALHDSQLLTLSLVQTGHTLTVPLHRHLTFGRSDPTSGWQPTIDLTPYRGKELGVSRIHADLYFEDKQAFLLELGSSNGTQVNGCGVQVGVPRQVYDGDEIALSRLFMRVYFDDK